MRVLGWISAIVIIGVLLFGALLLLVIRSSRDNVLLGQVLNELVARAKVLGLPDRDIVNVNSLIEYAEYDVALSILATQLYEHTILLDADYYKLLQSIAEKLKLPEQEYVFAKELVI